MTSTISNTVTSAVTLGSGNYTSPLTIASNGEIDPSAAGATALLIGIQGAVFNNGVIRGGAGLSQSGFQNNGTGGAGGIGVVMSAGSFTNTGRVAGGVGGEVSNFFAVLQDGAGGGGVVLSGGVFANAGVITGGNGGTGNLQGDNGNGGGALGGAGGYGVDISGGTLINTGTIIGGAGGANYNDGPAGSGQGGFGVLINGGTVINNGTISGPQDGVRVNNGVFIDNGIISNKYQLVTYNGVSGATPTVLIESGAVITNKFFAHGGSSTLGVAGATPFTLSEAGHLFYGFNAFTFASTLAGFGLSANAAYIDGGEPISGMIVGDNITLTNFAAVSDSFAAANELVLKNSGGTTVTLDLTGFTSTGQLRLSNDGTNTTLTAVITTISTAISPGIALGAGNYGTTLLVTNTGAITGGGGSAGGTSNFGIPTAGGAGGQALIGGAGGSLTNQGHLTGGAGGVGGNAASGGVTGGAGGTGGAGVSLASAAVTNMGVLAGGTGGQGGRGANGTYRTFTATNGGAGGAGGAGLLMNAGSGANQALISGGQGGAGGTGAVYFGINGKVVYSSGGYGGAGGTGLMLTGGATFTNAGTIAGGAGGQGGLNGNSRLRAGSGGQGIGAYLSGATLVNAGTISGGEAVAFGAAAATLVVENGAVFNGNIVANAAVADVLEFAGASGTTFSGIGTSTQNFNHISFAAGAAWTIEGNAAGLASGQTITGFAAGDRIILDNVAATGETLNAGKLTLGGATMVLGAATDAFVAVDNGTNTTIALAPASISLAAGGSDVVSGHTAGLTAVSITGFAAGDTIELEGFAATSETYEAGIGLVLGNGSVFETIAVNNVTGFFNEHTDGANTTIVAVAPVSIISTHLGNSAVPSNVILGGGTYANSLTITAAGAVGYPGFSASTFPPGSVDVYAAAGATGVSLTNRGLIYHANTGVYFKASGYINNSGNIEADYNGIRLKNGGTIVNSGAIKNGDGYAIFLRNGGTVVNSGYIQGDNGGIYSGQALTLIEAPGAVFGNGGRYAVRVGSGDGTLVLGAGTSSQDISGFVGISNISFAAGAAWTLEADTDVEIGANVLANAATIAGFTGADELILERFAATSENLSAGDLILRNNGGAETLNLGATLDQFVVVDDGTNSTISLNPAAISLGSGGNFTIFGNSLARVASTLTLDGFAATSETESAAGITLSNGITTVTITQPLALGEVASVSTSGGDTTLTFLIGTITASLQSGITLSPATYASALTIAATGIIPGLAGAAAVTAVASDTLTNQGALLGGAGSAGAYGFYNGNAGEAGGDGVDGLNGGVLANGGTITGGAGGAGGGAYYNPGVPGQGGDGVGAAVNAMITNAGTILGGNGGAGSFGARQNAAGAAGGAGIASVGFGTIINHATISGGAGGDGGPTHVATGGAGGAGGIGISSLAVARIINDGTISGGAGGAGGSPNIGGVAGGNGGAGGAGILALAGYIDNTGLIMGGAGGQHDYFAAADGPGGVGVSLSGGTLINAGTIAGADGADAVDFGVNAATLVVEQGARFIGAVAANNAASDILEFDNGAALALGNSFTGFAQTDILAGAKVTLSGTLVSAVMNDGTITTTDGTRLVITGALTGTGTIIDDPSDIVLDGSVAAGQTISFTGTGGTIELGDPAEFNGTIAGYGDGGTLILDGFTASSDTLSAGQLVLEGTAGGAAESLTINIAGSYSTAQFSFSSNGAGGTDIMPCFAAGVRILLASGALVRVEELREGDLIETYSGDAAPIIWIGRRTIAPRRHQRPEAVQPILISAGALGHGLPWRDLVVSPDHALYLEGHLIPAKALTNGATIRQLDCRTVTYYHVELPEHAVLFAEGAAAESYLETGNRAAFENGGGALTLHPDFAQESREKRGCAPFADSGPAVEAARQRILDHAAIETTGDPALQIRFENGRTLIASRTAVPGEIYADPRDRRRLGVKIAGLRVDGHEIALDHPALTVGWHDCEPDGRWTNGAAEIPQSLCGERQTLALTLAAALNYPSTPADGLKPARHAAGRL